MANEPQTLTGHQQQIARVTQGQELWEVIQSTCLRAELIANVVQATAQDWAAPEHVLAMHGHFAELRRLLVMQMGAIGEYMSLSADFNLASALQEARESEIH